jgi:hypothetical protein
MCPGGIEMNLFAGVTGGANSVPVPERRQRTRIDEIFAVTTAEEADPEEEVELLETEQLATFGKFRIEVDAKNGKAVCAVSGDRREGPFGKGDRQKLMAHIPGLERDLIAYANVTLILEYGSVFWPLTSEDEINFFKHNPSGEGARYDLASMEIPQIQDNTLVFFATVPGLGSVPYRITVPYPYREGVPCRAELLPFRKEETPVTDATPTDET